MAPEFKTLEEYVEQFTMLEQLGRGKFGVVYKVEDKLNKTIAAAKHIKARTGLQRARVVEEVSIISELCDQYIISFVAAFQSRQEMVVVTEYLDGGELFERVASEEYSLTELDSSTFIRQICTGLQYLHSSNIVHLDLKPENVVCINRTTTDIKIIDFGLARKLVPGVEVRLLCGTPEFLAPEIISYEPISCTTDMWAVGVMTYILLSGLSPFLADTDTDTFNNITRNAYHFDEEEFEDISECAKEFIGSLLISNKNSRMSAEECLNHPWLSKEGRSTIVLKTTRLRDYMARRRWQRYGQGLRALKRMSGMAKRRSMESMSDDERSPSRSSGSSTSQSSRYGSIFNSMDDLLLHEESNAIQNSIEEADDMDSSDEGHKGRDNVDGLSSDVQIHVDQVHDHDVYPQDTIHDHGKSDDSDSYHENHEDVDENSHEEDEEDLDRSEHHEQLTENKDQNDIIIDEERLPSKMLSARLDDSVEELEEEGENQDTFDSIQVPSWKKYNRVNTKALPGTVSSRVRLFAKGAEQHQDGLLHVGNGGKPLNRKSMKTRPRNVKLLAEKFSTAN